MKTLFTLVLSAVALLFAGCDSPKATQAKHIDKNALVIDVRTPEEFARGHIPGAVNVPVDTIATSIEQKAPDKSKPLYVHCQSGRRATIATEILEAKGYNVRNLGSLAAAKATLNR